MPNTIEIEGILRNFFLAANTSVLAGEMGCLNSDGDLVPASQATGLNSVGRIEETASSTQENEVSVLVKAGVFLLENHATDGVSITDIGADCYFTDTNEVAKTDGSDSSANPAVAASRSKAGVIFNIDGEKVAVRIS